MRIVGQMLSYEAPLLFSLLGVVMITGSLRLDDNYFSIKMLKGGAVCLLFLWNNEEESGLKVK